MDTTSHNPPEELIAQLSEHCKTKDDLDGIMKMMWQSLLNQALDTEMDEHLGYKKHESAGRGTDNRRNGRTSKTLKGELGPIEVETPRDRNGQFEPQIVPKHKRRFEAVEKAAIVRRHLIDKVPVSDLCDEYQLQPTQFYRWQKQLFDNAAAAFGRPGNKVKKHNGKDRKIAALEAKIQLKNEVVAELLQEHVQLKKELGEP